MRTGTRRGGPGQVVCVLAGLFAFSLGVAFASELPRTRVEVVRPGSSDVVLLTVEAELAMTSQACSRGLMERPSLPRDHGMLFLFEAPRPLSFWMLNTLIPLDIIFADEHRRIVTIHAAVPPCRPPQRCPTYLSQGPAQYVLEVNGGVAAEAGIGVGDKLRWAHPAVGRC